MGRTWAVLAAALVVAAAATLLIMSTSRPQQSAATSTTVAAAVATQTAARQTSTTTVAGLTTTTASPPPTRPVGFNASYYEANYTLTLTVSAGSISVEMRGWWLLGVGPLGNYTVLSMTAEMPGAGAVEAVYKAATKGNLTYVEACSEGRCVGRIEPINSTVLRLFADFINATRATGNCSYLNYTGVELEGGGNISTGALPGLGGLLNGTGNYTAKACVAYGIPLTASATMRINMSLYNRTVALQVSIRLLATRIGPYVPERYRQLLSEAEAAVEKSRGGADY
ncbi:MAG: hypothetical protein RQ839_07605 [Thermoproteus sp.]|jgi:hypothetical protein|nr:hypothetical protein [Thermoproteus sp.]MDT7881455.1 hypothetical protein [Thermoproteus sp.]